MEKYEYNVDGSLAASISGTTIHTYAYTLAGRLKVRQPTDRRYWSMITIKMGLYQGSPI